MPAIPPTSRAAHVYDSIRAEIVNGKLKPGSPLRLAVITKQHNVSMSVAREALTRLAEGNLAVLAPNQGFRVTEISAADLIDLTAMRIMLEGTAIEQSIERGDVQWEASVISAHHVLERAHAKREGDFASTVEWSEAHSRFHEALVSACGSPRLLSMTRSLRDSYELYRQLSGAGEAGAHRDLAAEHRHLMHLATARRGEEARTALIAHIQVTTDLVLAGGLLDAQ